ncbi:DUF3267 domain-containing protein [Cytobacillus sp. Hz8]|uniref:DUF3267 domain-containing protein n=1 Tax=Cytobacillus sp. Hz8 TaxID=3347168 RepID=UPI0035E06313
MKFTSKLPVFDEKLHAELIIENWKPLKEPNNFLMGLLSIPFIIIGAFIPIGIIQLVTPFTINEFGISGDGSFVINLNFLYIFLVLLSIILHELIHLMFIPNYFKSNCTYIGITVFGGFVATEEVLSKNRFILTTLAPFTILSIFLPIILGTIGILPLAVKVLIILNGAASSVDLLTFVIIISQVPNLTMLRNNGNKTYWKIKKC